MADIFTSLTTALGLSRQLVEIASLAKDAKAKTIAADLQLQLAEVKIRLAGLLEENQRLSSELKAAKSSVSEMQLIGDLYYKPDGDGPYCTACFDGKRQLIRVSPMSIAFHAIAKFKCNVCKAHFQGEK